MRLSRTRGVQPMAWRMLSRGSRLLGLMRALEDPSRRLRPGGGAIKRAQSALCREVHRERAQPVPAFVVGAGHGAETRFAVRSSERAHGGEARIGGREAGGDSLEHPG